MIVKRLVALGLGFQVLAPPFVLDRAPLVCLMGDTPRTSEVAHDHRHGMPHHASKLSPGAGSHSSTRHNLHNCACPWECGNSRGPAAPVQPVVDLNFGADHSAAVFDIDTGPDTPGDLFLPLTTGPPCSLRG